MLNARCPHCKTKITLTEKMIEAGLDKWRDQAGDLFVSFVNIDHAIGRVYHAMASVAAEDAPVAKIRQDRA